MIESILPVKWSSSALVKSLKEKKLWSCFMALVKIEWDKKLRYFSWKKKNRKSI